MREPPKATLKTYNRDSGLIKLVCKFEFISEISQKFPGIDIKPIAGSRNGKFIIQTKNLDEYDAVFGYIFQRSIQ